MWEEGASLAFVQAYLETAKEHAFLPDSETCAKLLDFFLLQHAMNELHETIGQPEKRLHAVLETTRELVERGE
jgi:hypothetical protein